MRATAQVLAVAALFSVANSAPATDPTSFWQSGFYDTCAITNCFVPITNSYPCEINDNSCVCTTSGFVSQVASCLATSCSPIVASTYNTYSSNCASTGYGLALTKTQFLSAAGALETWLSANFWNFYPACANTGCLSPLTAESGCDISNNECVCSNATLMTSMAGCIGKACSSTSISGTYSLYQTACSSNGGYSIALTSAQWEAAAGSGSGSGTVTSSIASSSGSTVVQVAGTSKTTSAGTTFSTPVPSSADTSASSSTTAQNSTPSTTPSSGGGGFTEDQKIALGVGLGMGLPAIVLAAVGICYKRN
ncbi:uncharacterized protein PAC_05544 [Phialocephala subalpina]|uniref:CFEM domain-containing protein n=1 Tax=Phialocephala subalpina TaxID=576137 RepID=A0A1L7WSB8_9HELO|nr:uncharacterized protein PAC_05544 [Phialocephala subalpina]